MMSFTAKRQPNVDYGATQRKHRPDYWLLVLSLLLMGVGLMVVFSISPGLSVSTGVSENYYVTKQVIAIVLGVTAFSVLAFMPLNILRHSRNALLMAAAAAAVAVRLFGEEVNGAFRWIQIGGLSFQAVELIKFALLIWTAWFLAKQVRAGELRSTQKTLKPLLIVLVIVGIVVAKFQSDLGSMAVVVAMMAAMAFIAGMPLEKVGLGIVIVAVGGALLIMGSSYRRERLNNFINPSQDCANTGYQACQALIAIGSGGLMGRGLGKSVQAYGYQPEAANDSIFAILAETFGFLGVGVLLALYLALFARLKRLIERTPDIFARLVLCGVLAWLSTQALINIGAMAGLLPLKGITLPFISYGGTSILFIMGALGVAFQISRYSTYAPIEEQQVEGAGNDRTTMRRRQRRPYYATFSRSS